MKDKSGQEEEEDARSLFDHMKETVGEMRRRRSIALRITRFTTPHAEGIFPRPLFALATPSLQLERPLWTINNLEARDEVVSTHFLPSKLNLLRNVRFFFA